MAWYSNTCTFANHQPEELHIYDMANNGVLSVFSLNCLQAILALLSGSLRDSCRQVVSQLWKCQLMTVATPNHSFILEPSVKNSRCDHWILMIFIELNLGFLSGDHTLAHSFNRQWVCVSKDHKCVFLVVSWVSSGGRPIRYSALQRPWLPLPWD